MAGPTGLEPATSDVTGRRSNQLNYDPAERRMIRAGRKDHKGSSNPVIPRSEATRVPSAFCRRQSATSDGVEPSLISL